MTSEEMKLWKDMEEVGLPSYSKLNDFLQQQFALDDLRERNAEISRTEVES